MRRSSGLLFVLFALAAPLAAEPEPAVTAAELRGHVGKLAADAWEGRGSGSAGERKATEYIAAELERLGCVPAGENGTFFQEVAMPGPMRVGRGCALEVPGVTDAFVLDRDFRPFTLSSSGTAQGRLVFAGYGVAAPDLGYDDYEGLDVSGSIVVVFRHLPHGGPWGGPRVRMRHAVFSAKLKAAVERGAIGLVVVNDPFHFRRDAAAAGGDGRGRRRPRVDALHRGGSGAGERRIPFVHLTLAAGERLFAAAFGATPAELEAVIHPADGLPRPASRASDLRARVKVDVEHTVLKGRNVCALLEAPAPGAANDVVVVGAHHDHIGRSGVGSLARGRQRREIHNGADDNASGTSGVLEVAEYLAARRGALRRSVLFLTFTGEERGLLGSRHFVEHPTIPLARMVAMLNMDMIGRLGGRKLFVGGVKTSPVFGPMLARLAGEVGLEFVAGDGGRAPSDNTSFYDKDMPVLFFFSGMHRDYHRPTDDAHKIDAAGMERVAHFAARAAEEIAKLPERPRFQRADSGGMGPPRAVLGIRTRDADGGVAIAFLGRQSPAAKAGLQVGDVLVSVAGKKTPDLAALVAVMRTLGIGQKVAVEAARDGVPFEVEVTLGRG